jgi:hypothetical protein
VTGTLAAAGYVTMVGDSGSGGVKGAVPAPATGDASHFLRGDATWAAVSGSGTVTTVSVATANGISGTVANATTTPAITLALGAISPSSVGATNTTDQLILGTTNTTTISATAPASSIVGTIPDFGAAFVFAQGTAAHNCFFTTSGNTNVTLPTSGTLVNTGVTTLSSLTSVGTIATGVWQGTVVGATYGGTGVNNGSSTITLGGNLVTSGANPLTLTTTGSTNVTLPTSGTLTTLATVIGTANTWTAAQTFTNSDIKLLGSSTGATTLTSANSSGTNYTLTLPAVTDTVACLGTVQSYTSQQNFTGVSTTSSSNSTAWNLSTAQSAFQSMTENTTLANPSNQVNGGTYVFQFIQNASAAKTLAFGTNYIWNSSGAPTISATLSSVLICTFVSDGTKMRGAYVQYAS